MRLVGEAHREASGARVEPVPQPRAALVVLVAHLDVASDLAVFLDERQDVGRQRRAEAGRQGDAENATGIRVHHSRDEHVSVRCGGKPCSGHGHHVRTPMRRMSDVMDHLPTPMPSPKDSPQRRRSVVVTRVPAGQLPHRHPNPRPADTSRWPGRARRGEVHFDLPGGRLKRLRLDRQPGMERVAQVLKKAGVPVTPRRFASSTSLSTPAC